MSFALVPVTLLSNPMNCLFVYISHIYIYTEAGMSPLKFSFRVGMSSRCYQQTYLIYLKNDDEIIYECHVGHI